MVMEVGGWGWVWGQFGAPQIPGGAAATAFGNPGIPGEQRDMDLTAPRPNNTPERGVLGDPEGIPFFPCSTFPEGPGMRS